VASRENEEKLIADLDALLLPDFINVLLPLSTEDQDFYAAHEASLRGRGWNVVVASVEALRIANDKHALMLFASERGFAIPDSVIAYNREQLEECVQRYVSRGLRCVLKLAKGTGTQGVKILDPRIDRASSFWRREQVRMSPAEALEWFERYGLSEPVMVSEFLEGQHISVDAINTELTGYIASTRTEDRHYFGSALLGQTIENPSLIEESKRLVDAIGLSGAINLEYRLDEEGRPKILEINPRFGASIEHTVSAGLNLPHILVRSVIGLKSDISIPVYGTWFAPTWQNQIGASK